VVARNDEQKLLSKKSYAEMFSPQMKTDRNGPTMGMAVHRRVPGRNADSPRGETMGFARACSDSEARGGDLLSLNNGIEGTSQKLMKFGEQVADILIFNRSR